MLMAALTGGAYEGTLPGGGRQGQHGRGGAALCVLGGVLGLLGMLHGVLGMLGALRTAAPDLGQALYLLPCTQCAFWFRKRSSLQCTQTVANP